MNKSPSCNPKKILEDVSAYYTGKISQHGTTPAGVDWKDERSQLLRFGQLYKLMQHDPLATLHDIGCGYGAFLPYIRAQGFQGHYTGFDCSAGQIDAAKSYLRKALPDDKGYEVIHASTPGGPADYSVASGIFNVKMHITSDEWRDYILTQLDVMNANSRKGFAFNCLTSYADWRRDDLYYTDPTEFFNFCRKQYSRHIALLHDYGLYEFTLIVRKEV